MEDAAIDRGRARGTPLPGLPSESDGGMGGEAIPVYDLTVGSDGSIRIRWHATNTETHRRFIREVKRVFRRAGYPLVFTRTMGIETNSHQVGTLRFGRDPATSVLDPLCKTHDFDNLYVVDASFFPSSAAVNPALTVIAQALRVADHLLGKPLRSGGL